MEKKPVTSEVLFYYQEEELNKIKQFVENHPDLNFIQVDRNIEEDWLVWKRTTKNASMHHYLFAELHPKQLGKSETLLIFLNIPATIECLKTHYTLFQNELNQPFDPYQVIQELKVGRSNFWNRVFENAQLEGILLGFGLKNSELFKRATSENRNLSHEKHAPFPSPPQDLGKPCNGQTLLLPSFACMDFNESMELLKEYALTRDRIIEECRGKSIEDFVITKLLFSPQKK